MSEYIPLTIVDNYLPNGRRNDRLILYTKSQHRDARPSGYHPGMNLQE